jgi:hypothetical protein
VGDGIGRSLRLPLFSTPLLARHEASSLQKRFEDCLECRQRSLQSRSTIGPDCPHPMAPSEPLASMLSLGGTLRRLQKRFVDCEDCSNTVWTAWTECTATNGLCGLRRMDCEDCSNTVWAAWMFTPD